MNLRKYTIIVIFNILVSVTMKGQHKFDLLELELPIEKSVLFNEKFTIDHENTPKFGMTYYGAKSKDPNLLYVCGNSVSTSKKDKIELVLFLKSENDNIVCCYLRILNTENTHLTELALNKKYGNPNYRTSIPEREDFIWEDKGANNLVYFAHFYPKDESQFQWSEVCVFNLDDIKVIKDIGSPNAVNYYEYLTIRKEKDDPDYSYRDFAEYQKKVGYWKYLQDIENLFEH